MKNFFSVLVLTSAIMAESYGANNVWSTPFTISPVPSNIISPPPPLAIDSHSNAVVGWGLMPNNNPLLTSYQTAGTTTWNSPITLFTATPPQQPTTPLTFTFTKDRQIAAWSTYDPTNNTSTIYTSRRATGLDPWGTPVSLNVNAQIVAGNAMVGDKGDILAALATTTNFNPPFDIIIVPMTANSPTWGPIITVGQDNDNPPVVNVTVNDGRAVVVWNSSSPSQVINSVRFTFKNNVVTPLPPLPMPAGITNVFGVQITSDIDGNAMMFFTVTDGTTDFAYVSILKIGSNTWSTPQLVSNPSNDARSLSIQLSDNSVAEILWAETTSLGAVSFFAEDVQLNGTLSNLTLLEGPIPGPAFIDESSEVSVDTFGNAVAIWSYQTFGSSPIHVASKPVGGSWSSFITLSTNGAVPSVVLSDQETAVAVWLDRSTLNLLGSTNLAVFDLHGVEKFVGRVIKNKFLNATEFALRMRWTPTPLLHITSYEIRRDGVLIAVIPGKGPFEFIDILRSRHVNAIYTITSVASNGNRSLPVPLTIKK